MTLEIQNQFNNEYINNYINMNETLEYHNDNMETRNEIQISP